MKQLIKIMTFLISMSLFAAETKPWYSSWTNAFGKNIKQTYKTIFRPGSLFAAGTAGLLYLIYSYRPTNRDNSIAITQQETIAYPQEEKQDNQKQSASLQHGYLKRQTVKTNLPTKPYFYSQAPKPAEGITHKTAKTDLLVTPEQTSFLSQTPTYRKYESKPPQAPIITALPQSIAASEDRKNKLAQWRKSLNLPEERENLRQQYKRLDIQLTDLRAKELLEKKNYTVQKQQLVNQRRLIITRLNKIAHDLHELPQKGQ